LAAVAGLAAVMAGCEVDSFLEPGPLVRLEHTPTTVPILERIAQIEGPAGDGVEFSKITPEDLLPDPSAYRLGPGDVVEVDVQDIIRSDIPDRFERDVDARGFLDLPRLPSVNVMDLTVAQAQEAIGNALRAAQLTDKPIVSVRVVVRRQLTFNVIGGVASPGTYAVSRPNFRLLEALAQAGRFNENIAYVYVVRGVPLTDRAAGREWADRPARSAGDGGAGQPAQPTQPSQPAQPTPPKDNILDLIDELSKEPAKPAPAAFATRQPAGSAPAEPAAPPPPPIDLPEPGAAKTADTGGVLPMPYPAAEEGPDWVFIRGQWVRAARRNLQQGTATDMPGVGGAATQPPPNPAADLYTQRVIRIEVAPLLAGSAQHNIVVRPGDIIRVPSPSEGVVYVAGEVARPGPYSIPASGRLTALRAITAAGGLSQTAVPWRAEIIRMVGPDRQAIMRIDLKAIAEGTQPDIFLKSDDQLNVGTSFWAFPLAVIRSGFRASYGFGFILDRNFGPDVFGERRFNN
jgi:protein involved in polysaccharide export with SLBB domain